MKPLVGLVFHNINYFGNYFSEINVKMEKPALSHPPEQAYLAVTQDVASIQPALFAQLHPASAGREDQPEDQGFVSGLHGDGFVAYFYLSAKQDSQGSGGVLVADG